MEKTYIDEKLNKQNIRTDVICEDNNFFWFNDESINGLFTIKRSDFEVKNILNSSQLFKFGGFKIRSILAWEEKIVIVPRELDREWVIYNKETKEILYKKILESDFKTVGICRLGDRGILVPASSQYPVIIMDLKTMTSSKLIYNWNNNSISADTDFSARNGLIVDNSVFFHLYNTTSFFKVSQNGVKGYEVDIPNGICSMDYHGDIFWVLPTNGECIYTIDLIGRVSGEYSLSKGKKKVLASNFVRIIASFRYIFLLPIFGEKLHVYDIFQKEVYAIGPEIGFINSEFPISRNTVPYWEYYIDEEKIYFFPLGKKFLIIDLNTLKWREEDLYLPNCISGRGLRYWYWWNQWFQKGAINKEQDGDSLEIYLSVVESKKIENSMEKIYVGESIWRKMIK